MLLHKNSLPARYTQRALIFVTEFIALLQLLGVVCSEIGVRLNGKNCLSVLALSLLLAAAADRLFGLTPESNAESSEVLPHVLPSALYRSALAVFVLAMGTIVGVAWRQGDLSYDGNAYHTLAVNQWAVNQRIVEISPAFEVSPFANGYPKGAEVVAFVFAQAFGSRLLGILNFAYAPLGLLGIALLCQVFGASLRDGVILGGFFLLIPTNLYQYGTTLVDTAYACSAISLWAFLALDLQHGDRGLNSIFATGCAIGNTIAAKSTGLLIVTVSLCAFLICKVLLRPPERAWFFKLIGKTAASSVVGLATGGFWYFRNCALHGNPLYPAQVSWLEHVILPGVPLSTILKDDVPPLLRNMPVLLRLALSWLIPLLRWKAWYHEVELGALGAFWLLACIPAICFCLWQVSRRNLLDRPLSTIYFFLSGSVAVCLLGTPLSFRSRFTAWLFALGMPSIPIVLNAAQARANPFRRFFRPWVIGCSALLLGQALILGADRVAAVVPCGLPGNAMAHAGVRELPLLPLYPEMNSALLDEIMRSEESIAVGPDGKLGHERRIYGQLAVPLGRHDLVPIRSSITAEELNVIRTGTGLHYVLWLSSQSLPPALSQRAQILERDTPFTLLHVSADKGTTVLHSPAHISSALHPLVPGNIESMDKRIHR